MDRSNKTQAMVESIRCPKCDTEIKWHPSSEEASLRAEIDQARRQREYDNEQMDRYEARIAELEARIKAAGYGQSGTIMWKDAANKG